MKALKIIGVVLGAILLLGGAALLAGSALVGQGQGAFDEELAKSGLAGPVSGTVLSIDQGAIYTVSFVDQQGQPRTGAGPVASGTDAPEVGETVSVFYNTTDPSQIVILNIPGGGFLGIADTLRTVGIVCVIVGAVLLAAGIISLLVGRKHAAVTGSPAGYPPVQPGAQPPPPGYPQQQPPPGYPQPPPPSAYQQPPPGYPSQPPAGYQQQPPAGYQQQPPAGYQQQPPSAYQQQPPSAYQQQPPPPEYPPQQPPPPAGYPPQQ